VLKKIILSLLGIIVIVALLGTFVGWYLSVPVSAPEQARIQKAAHYVDNKFANPEGQSSWEFSVRNLQLAFFGEGKQEKPASAIPVVSVETESFDHAPQPGLRYLWLGHSSVLLEIDGVRVLLDPVLSERVSPFSFAGPTRFHRPEHRVFYSGDTGASLQFAKLGEKFGPFDLGVIKVGAYGPDQAWLDVHMAPEDSVQTALDVQASVLLPVHWGTFDLAYHAWDEPAERVLQSAGDAGVTLVMPRPGEWVEHTALPSVDTWWREVD